jgi:diguanylate cyclase
LCRAPAPDLTLATILVIDDSAPNRQLLIAALHREGHVTLEATDGAEGLSVARAGRPDLVISDVLMPSMDGYEFVRQLRADHQLATTAVIFYTAHFHEQEARTLAAECGVARVLLKPARSAEIMEAVDAVLRRDASSVASAVSKEQFEREHLRLLTNKLADKASKLLASNARLALLTDLNLHLAAERDPHTLLTNVANGARRLLGARYAVLVVSEVPNTVDTLVAVSGVQFEGPAPPPVAPHLDPGPLGRVCLERTPWRARGSEGRPASACLPAGYPAARSFLAVPISALTDTYGWLCLADKRGADEFDEEDERVLGVFGAQVGRIFENGRLYRAVQRHATQLEREIEERERATADLLESEERFRQLADNIDEVLFVTTPDYAQTLYVSAAYDRIWGVPRDPTSPGADWAKAVVETDRARVLEHLQRKVGTKTMDEIEYQIQRPDGSRRWIAARSFPLCDASGTPFRIVGVATDITDRRRAEDRIRSLNRVHAMLSGINSLIVRVRLRDELFQGACRLAIDKGGFRLAWIGLADAATGEITAAAHAGDSHDLAHSLAPRLTDSPASDGLIAYSIRHRQPRVCNDLLDGTMPVPQRDDMLARGFRSLVALPLLAEDRAVGCLCLASDQRQAFDAEEMTLLKELADDISFALDHLAKAEKLSFLAYYDPLTGLANRTLFHERLSQHLLVASRVSGKVALLIAEPDQLDTINASYGRNTGDQVLKQIAVRFARFVGEPYQVARVSSSNFAAVIPFSGADDTVARAVSMLYRDWLGEPFTVDGRDVTVSGRIGISIYPDDGSDADALLKNAELALKKARTSPDRHVFFTPQLSDKLTERLSVETQLRRAVDNEEFVLHYQPKVDVDTRRIEGVEALIRWQTRERGLVGPGTFIPILEETGLIAEVGAWALQQAALDRAQWLEKGLAAPRIAVNVSTVQLRRPDFVNLVANIVRISGANCGLDIEVTESLLLDDAEDNIEKLRAIKQLGVGIAIDDFGTGYSSLGYLAKLPVDSLKIDRSFISAMLEDPSAMTLVSTMITLAHALKLEVIAEGVESEEQAKILRLLRCDQMQGFLISKPLSFDDLVLRLSRSKS